MVTPNTNITLLKTPMELDENNTLTFSNETAKYNYFNSLTKLSLTGATYQRENGVVRYPTNPNGNTYEDLIKYNYCMYQNTSYDSKWFYAFIEDIKYINDGMCEIKLKTDSFMTWQNDITYKTSFIERQHVADDTIGKHTIPENVETGEFIVASQEHAQIGGAHVVIASAWNPFRHMDATSGEWSGGPAGGIVNGIYQGCDYILLGNDAGNYGISEFLNILSQQGKADAMLGLFMLPDELTGYDSIEWSYMHTEPGDNPKGQFKKLGGTSTAPTLLDKTITKNYTSIDGYTPKNNKLFTAQFNYLMVSNNCGGNALYNYEDFSTNDCMFRIRGAIAPGGSIRSYPRNYKGVANNMEEGLNGGKYPICSYVTDMYTNWLTQNSVNVKIGEVGFDIKPGDMGIASGLMSIVGGVGLMATGSGGFAGAGSVLSGGMQIANSVAEQQRHSKQPPQFGGNINAGDVMYAMDWIDITFRKQTIKKEYAKIIDDYFSMYGYKVNSVEVINPHKRTYYDYIKTIGCNITGNIPQSELIEIKSLFDKGITLWHNTSHFLDYSVNNSIIS